MDAKISTKTNTLAKGLIEKNVSFIEETTSKIAQKKRRAIDEKINEMKLVEIIHISPQSFQVPSQIPDENPLPGKSLNHKNENQNRPESKKENTLQRKWAVIHSFNIV